MTELRFLTADGSFSVRGILCLFTVMADGIHEWFVRHHEKNRRVIGDVLVMMMIPERDNERVALFPLVAFITDDANAAATVNIIDRGTRMTMALGLFAGT